MSDFSALHPNGTTIIVSVGVEIDSRFSDGIIEFNSKVTNWDTDTLITGINIVDDMLFWTDNETEPKKINIPRSKEGTFQYDNLNDIKHTHLFVDGDDKGFVKESHITVARPKPKSRINLEMKSPADTNTGVYGYTRWHGRISGSTSEFLKPGDNHTFDTVNTIDTVSFNGVNSFDYQIGDIILLKYQPGAISQFHFPIYDYDIKAKVTNITNNIFGSITAPTIATKIIDVNYDNYPGIYLQTASLYSWAVQKELHEDQLFELKFPRFSYRWKFSDGEYSTFAPWSNIGFLPGNFQYLPKEGFNVGMVNSLRELILWDFITPDTPLDVTQIDLLYKESDSPNVYIVDTLKPDDIPPIGIRDNPWNSYGSQGPPTITGQMGEKMLKGKYKVTSETIFATVSSNQLIRNWDAVPRRALAQEIIGNRLTYANYVRNFNLNTNSGNFKQDLTALFKSSDVGSWENKSVKTIRDYQIGISYTDEYGRETPVFTTNDSIVSIPKLFSSKSNILYSKINHLAPQHANAYKFYVKENSTKYYNLVMDRWYDAEDGDIWLSFNSHDRNKVDDETFLYLKRGHNGEVAEDNYRYKILSIKNEAPEFIRNVRKQFGIKPNDPTDFGLTVTGGLTNATWWDTINVPNGILGSSTSLPIVGKKTFTIDKDVVDNSSWSLLNSFLKLNLKNRVRFLKYPSTTTLEHRDNATFHFDESPEKISAWYKIDKVISAGSSDYMINLGKELGNDCLFVTDTSVSPNVVNNYVAIEIAQEEAENLPEFDGRFFVKVLRDANINEYITNAVPDTVLNSQSLFYFDQPDYTGVPGVASSWADPNSIGLQLYKEEVEIDSNNYGSGSIGPVNDTNYVDAKTEWTNYFGDGTVLEANLSTGGPKWFIDKLKYAGQLVGATGMVSPPTPFQLSDGTPGAGDGVNTANKTIDISFSGHTFHNAPYQFPNGGFYPCGTTCWSNSLSNTMLWFGGNISHWGIAYGPTWGVSPHILYNSFVDNIHVGATFRFSEDPFSTLYTITAVDVFTIWNYVDEDIWYKGTIFANGQGNSTVTTGYRYTDPDYAKGWDGYPYSTQTSGTYPNMIHNLQDTEATADNRRITFRLHLDKAVGVGGGYNPTINDGTNDFCTHEDADCSIEFVERNLLDEIEKTSNTPAIWETEPKEESDIDIYYEASQTYPMRLTTTNIVDVFSLGDKVKIESVNVDLDGEAEIEIFDAWRNGVIQIKNVNTTSNFNWSTGWRLARIYKKNEDINYIELNVNLISQSGETADLQLDVNTHNWGRTLDWFNSYSFGNGVESDTIRDDFNQVEIGNGVTASTTVGWQYEEETLKNGLIFSGLYNAKTGLNDLNQFIEAENITKDVNPSYGSIQKLYTRDSDLVTFCEDKVLKILANKDALYNADENPNLISAENVLGQTLPFIGDYGISKNPESFARENFRSYFTDRKRGAVLRLSRDGLTPISDNGMKDWFRDNLKSIDTTDVGNRLYGSYDNHKSHYNLSLVGRGKTVVFNEASNGWVSFRSFVPEGGESMNNDYFTFKEGKLYKHHVGPINTFYNPPSVDSSLSFVFNEAPSVIKSFTTLNYEGTQSRVEARDDENEYINLNNKLGWWVEDIHTDTQEGSVKSFIEKEGKWFNHIMGESTNINNIDPEEFSFQGISPINMDFGSPRLIHPPLIYGCDDEYIDNPSDSYITTGPCI